MKHSFFFVVFVLLISLCACGNNTPENHLNSSGNSVSDNGDYYESSQDVYSSVISNSKIDFDFYDLNHYSFGDGTCILAGIDGCDYEDGKAFVYFDSNTSGLILQNGFISTIYNQRIENGTFKSTTGRGPYAYNIVSSKGISFGPDGSAVINSQTFVTDHCCILDVTTHFARTSNKLLIPANCLNFSTYSKNYDGNGNSRIFVFQ